MVFGVIEGDAGRQRASDELRRVFLAVAIDVDVEPLLSGIMPELTVIGPIVIVPDDLGPLAPEAVFQLDGEPSHLTTKRIETNPLSERSRKGLDILPAVFAGDVSHQPRHRHDR